MRRNTSAEPPVVLALWFLQCVEIPVQSKRWAS